MIEKRNKGWTSLDLRQLKSMAEYGYSSSRIARDLGRSAEAVTRKARENKIDLRANKSQS